MPERDYFIVFTDTDRVRVWILTERGDVRNFTAQYEAFIDDEWYPVVRYDSWHDRPHRDTLDRFGHVRRKTWLTIDYADGLDFAISDLRLRWQAYRENFVRRMQ